MATNTNATPQKEEVPKNEGLETPPDSPPFNLSDAAVKKSSAPPRTAAASPMTRTTRCCPRRRSIPSRLRTSSQTRPSDRTGRLEAAQRQRGLVDGARDAERRG
jgi:hypothetical protein